MSYPAGASLDYDLLLQPSLVGSISSSSGYGYSRLTPQDSLPRESLLGESVSAPQGSEGASSQSLSIDADMGEAPAAHEVAFHGNTGFEPPSSQSVVLEGQIPCGTGNDMTDFMDGIVESGSWVNENQGQARCRRP